MKWHIAVIDIPAAHGRILPPVLRTHYIPENDCLTSRQGEGYCNFVTRVLANSLAARVKILDIDDNMALSRMTNLTTKDLEHLQNYHTALGREWDA